MARPGDAEDAIRGTGEDDYTSDPPEFRRDAEVPQDETEKRSLLARALERIQKTADGVRSTLTSGFEALNRRTQKEGVQPPEPLDPNGFLEEEQQAQDTLGKIIEEVNGGTMDATVARKQVAEINVNLVSGYQQKVDGHLRRLVSWAMGRETQASQQTTEGTGEDDSMREASFEVTHASAQGAPLSRLGELAQKGIDRVFGQKTDAGPTVEAPTGGSPAPEAPVASPPGTEDGESQVIDPFENQKTSAKEFVDSFVHKLKEEITPLFAGTDLSPEERAWTLRKFGRLGFHTSDLLQQYNVDLVRATSDARRGQAFSKITFEVTKLVDAFPVTKEAIREAMAAEAAASAASAKGPEAPQVPGAETPENPTITAEKNRLATRLQINRGGVEAGALALEARCVGNPDLKSRLDKLNAQITRDFENVGTDLTNSKTMEDVGKAERRIGETYGNLIDALTTLTELAGATQLSLETQKKMTELEVENASLKTRMADLEARMQAVVDAQASGGKPTGPGAGGPGAPGGPSGPSDGPTPPPGGSGPTGPGGPTPPEPPPAPELGEPGDPEKTQAEAIKTELETTLIPKIQAALAGREYLHDVQVFLPIKLPENPGAMNGIELLLEGHIDSVNGAPAQIDQRLVAGTMLEARQFAQDAKVHAEAIIKFLQEPLSPEAEQRAVEALNVRFVRTAAGYQRNIETANNDLFPRTKDLMQPMGIDTAPLRELFIRTGEIFNHIEDLLAATPPNLSVIVAAYRTFQTEVDEVAQEVARLQQEVVDGTLGARAQRAAGSVRDAGAAAGRAVRDAGPSVARAVGRADRAWERRIDRNLERSGRADSFEDRARRFFHGLGERFRSNLADRLGLGFNSAIIRFHERGVEDIALRTDALREEINNPEDGLVVLIAESRRILDPSNPDELPPGEIATERREYNRLVRELGARQRDLDRDLGTLERRRAAAQPYFDVRQDIATDAKLRLEQYTGERAARYDAARKRSGQIRGELSAAESDRDQLSAEIQTVRLSLHTERRALRAGLRRQITRMESQLRSMNREIGPQRRVLATVNNDIASLAPHVTYWRDQVLPEFTRFSREPVPVNHGNFGPREVPGLDTTRHSTRPAPTIPDSFTGAPIAGGSGGGGTPEAPAPATAGGEQGRTGVEAGDENIRISPRDIAEALFRKWGSQIGVASADGMATEMQNFITAPQRFATGLDQKFELSQLRDFITEFNQHLNAAHFNKVDLRTLRTLTRDLRSRAGAENRAA